MKAFSELKDYSNCHKFTKSLPSETVDSNSYDDTRRNHAREIDPCYHVDLFVRWSLHVRILVGFVSWAEVTATYFGHVIE
jgi:hypothetical protein